MNRTDADSFFRKLLARAPEDAAVVVSAFPSGESIALSADNYEGIAAAAEAAEVDRQDAYFSVCLVGTDFDASKGRGKKPDYRAGVAIWADLDVRSPAHKAAPETLPPTAEDAAELLDEVAGGALAPTALVASGHGLHAYLFLEAPVTFGVGGALSAEGLHFAAVVEAYQEQIREAAARRGWHVDLLADVPRVLRIPGTSNFKLPGDVRVVELLLDDGPRHDFGDVAEALGLPRLPSKGAGKASAGAAAGPSPGPGTEAGVDLDDVRKRLGNLRNENSRAFAAKILAGESFAEPGERDRMLQRAASLVAFVEPNARAEDLAEIFRPSFAVWAAEPGARSSVEDELEKATDKLRRAQIDGRRKKAAAAEANERIKGLLEGRIPRTAPEPTAATMPAPGAEDEPEPEGDEDAGESRQEMTADAPSVAPRRVTAVPPVAPGFKPYTEDEIVAIADDLGCKLPELNKRWIVQHKSAFFVLVDGRYKRPITEKELDVSLPRDLKRSPVEFWIEKASGEGQRPAKTSEILRAHATVARTLVSSLSAQRSIYEAETETFIEAVCPIRPIEPRFDQDVQDWLEAFGGTEREKLLDWVATCDELERYTCALYLSGPPETGKSLFAQGLSRLWTLGGPSELGRVLENFNEDLIRSPLIMADEHIPVGSRGHRASTELRNLIGNNRRTLNRKFLPQSPLVGAIRLILAANNDRLLAFSEDLSVHDLEAVAERFLYIDTAGAQGFFSQRFEGGKAPDSWVEGDTIAAHALWLRDHRAVNHKGRFLVSGSKSTMHQMLATSGRASGVVEFIAKYLSATANQRQPIDVKKLILTGKGNLYVNTLAVADHWELFVPNERAPTTTKVGRALAGLAVDDKEHRLGGVRYHKISYELILAWMVANQVGSPETARAMIEAK